MFRHPFACAGLLMLVGCGSGGTGQPAADTANATAPMGNDEVEALPSDSLAAPEGMALDSESNGSSESNAAGSASGGKAM